MKTLDLHQTATARQAGTGDPQAAESVRRILAALTRFIGAYAIYERNNPNLANFARAIEQSLQSYFTGEKELLLTVTQHQLSWRNHVVYDIGASKESIAFQLFKDGVGELSIHAPVTMAEIERFVEVLHSELYKPSAQVDIVTRLWRSDFSNIFYRILDEEPDGKSGDGAGGGAGTRQQPLSANDHRELDAAQAPAGAGARHSDSWVETLGAHFNTLAAREGRTPDPQAREQRLQEILAEHFAVSAAARAEWCRAAHERKEHDELISLLQMMFDFTRIHCPPPVVRDVTDVIERLTHSMREEANVATLTAALKLRRSMDTGSLDWAFGSLPNRVEAELTDSALLMSLTQAAGKSNADADELLEYMRLVGEKAVVGLCQMLAESTDPSLHQRVCGMLIELAGFYIVRVVDGFDIENPYLAFDAVHLLCQSAVAEFPPVVSRILSSRNPKIRECAIEFLLHTRTEESTRRLVDLLKDDNEGVRIRALVAIEDFPDPLLAGVITTLCFDEQSMLKSPDELEHMFRALGKQAGPDVLPRIGQTVAKKRWLPGGKSALKRNKLLAVTALRHIPGEGAQAMLERLSHDRDRLVRSKALHMLKQRNEAGEAPS